MQRKSLLILGVAMALCLVAMVPVASAADAFHRGSVASPQNDNMPSTTGEVAVAYKAAGGEAKAAAAARGKGATVTAQRSDRCLVVDPPQA
jgi:hypothetical protein